MKIRQKTTITGKVIGVTLALSATSQAATTLAESDMGNSAVIGAAASDLDAGTTGGTWTTNFTPVNTNNIVGNGTGTAADGFATGATDFALLVDEGGQGGSAQGANAVLNLGLDADFTSSAVEVGFDLAYSRSGGGKFLAVFGYAADDTTEVFRISWNLGGATTGDLTGVGDPTNLALGNALAFAGSGNAYDPSLLQSFNITLDGTTLTYSVDGLAAQSTTVLNTGTELSSISWEITGGSNNNQGFWLDNVAVTAIPEPSSTVLLGLAGLALTWRRRK